MEICECGNEFEITAESKLIAAIFSQDIKCPDCINKLNIIKEESSILVNGLPLSEYLKGGE